METLDLFARLGVQEGSSKPPAAGEPEPDPNAVVRREAPPLAPAPEPRESPIAPSWREPTGRFSREALARELNERQLEAVVFPPKPLLVVAGAGSGKTRVITFRVARLVACGVDPRTILAVTFTNKAAGEMRERVAKLLNEGTLRGSPRPPAMGSGKHSSPAPDARVNARLDGLWIGTFHAVAARLLRRYGEAVGLRKDFVIYDDDDQRRLMTRVLSDLKVPERLFPVRQVLAVIDRAKNQAIDAAGFVSADYFDDVVAKAYRSYEQRLRAANATDFGGLLALALRLCMPDSPAAAELAGRFGHVMVDEFQDTNSVQYRLVRFLSGRTHSITVVGDEDQSIYRWRGADIRNILDFERDHSGAGVVKLEQNYRSSANILSGANAIITRNTERRPKRLFTAAGAGAPIVVYEGQNERDEAEFVASNIEAALQQDAAPRDFAVFYRTNGQSRVLEEALRTHDLPYVVVGGTRFYDRAEIKDLLAYLRVVSNPDDPVALLRIVNVPARGIGDATIERVAALAVERGASLSAALEIAVEERTSIVAPAVMGTLRGSPTPPTTGSGERLAHAQARALASPAPNAILGSGPRRKVAAFVALMRGLREAAGGLSPAELAERVLEVSGYRDALAAEASLEAEGRLENLLELVAQMREYERETAEPTLSGFLERVALASDVDGYDPERGAISLMTVHTAKGLEFPVVFLTGLEEGVFPHARSVDDDSAIEEERRLCYVAVTRAMKRLHLSRVRLRRLSGQQLGGGPSRFLRDLPPECVESIVTEPPTYMDVDTEGAGPWAGRWNRGPAWSGRGVGLSRGRAVGSGVTDAATGRSPGVTVHYDEEAVGGEDLGLRVGAKLVHSRFGVGEVRSWQAAGGDLKVTMRFSSAGVKTILARFLRRP